MSRFYASISGQAKTDATREGSAKSGINGHIRGWDLGIEVCGYDENGVDCFDVYLTSGSNGHRPPIFLGTARRGEGPAWRPK